MPQKDVWESVTCNQQFGRSSRSKCQKIIVGCNIQKLSNGSARFRFDLEIKKKQLFQRF